MFFKSNKSSHLTDKEIIAKYRITAEKNLIGILFDRHVHLVYGICYRYLKNEQECKDAALEIFEKLMDDLLYYEVTNFSAWIHSVARNYCLARIEKKKNIFAVENIIDTPECLFDSEVENEIDKKIASIPAALTQISNEQRQCVELFYLARLSYAEISSTTGYSLNKVKSCIQNGKRNLKIFFDQAR